MAMSFDIQPVLFDFLSRRKSVMLPGVGNLVWKVQQAHKGQALSELKPPSIHLDIEEESGSSDIFVNYLSHQFQLPKEEAQSIFTTWIDRIKENLNSGDVVEIDNVGRLSRGPNNAIQFEQDSTLVASFFHLPTVRLTPISRKYLSEGITLPVHSEDSLVSRVMINVIVPLLLVVAIGILSYFLLQQPLFTGDQPISQAIDTAEASVNRTDSHSEDEEAIINENNESEQAIVSDTSGQNSIGDSSTESESAEVYMEERLDEDEAEARLSDFNDRFCIIILGSFKNSANVDVLIQRISERGLEVYTEAYNDFMRVGVRFDCYQKDLYRTLFQLRGEFGEDAWILKYKE